MHRYAGMVREDEGKISNEVFSASAHADEMKHIFGRCWLFVAHDTMIPEPGDYITNLMGADQVVVQRDKSGKVRVYLNKCLHRGAELCLYESGNSRSFTCSYHGWTYDDGQLVAVPFSKQAYLDELDRSKLKLIEAQVGQFGGLIFAAWDPVTSLDDYLGDAKWYLENLLLQEDMGGLEALPGVQKYMMPINWKLLAENFAGDDYHFVSTHGSLIKLQAQSQDKRIARPDYPGKKLDSGYWFSIAANHRSGAPHGFLELKVGGDSFAHDMAQASTLGPDSIEWLTERQRRAEERFKTYALKPYSFHVGNIFPNFALIGCGTAMYAKGFILHHPASADATEVWISCLVEKSAPKAVKDLQKFVLMQRQSAAGMVAPDDHENFARIKNNLRSPKARSVNFNYAMAIGHDSDDHWPAEVRDSKRWPGLVLPQFSEVIQRDFYRYWSELMGEA
jgi:phenylpropionate dioxygenase-like ring-hydroxylating dioxygenase large terminal subunit